MVNDFSRKPIVLTNAMGSTYRNSSPPNTLSIYPLTIYWENPTNIGDTFVFADPAGNTIFAGRCEAANQSQYFDVAANVRWNDWQLTTLGSGTIYLYFNS